MIESDYNCPFCGSKAFCHPIAEDAAQVQCELATCSASGPRGSTVDGALNQWAKMASALYDTNKPSHKCRPVARARMAEGRDWWMGELTEPHPSFPYETHCLHMKTPLKDVVFLINDADLSWLLIMSMAVKGGSPDVMWLQRMMAVSVNEAQEIASPEETG